MLPYNKNQEISEEDSAEEGFEWWMKSHASDNVPPNQNPKKEPKMYEMAKSPTIMIWNDEDVGDIEIAKIESYCDRMLTPEGNVKYKNYKVLAPTNASIRIYSPSGDINTTPKRGKIVPKFEINETVLHKEKLIELIEDDSPFKAELRAIIRPTGLSRQNLEALRRTNASRLEDYIQFMNSVNFTPSPSFSMFSDDVEYYTSPPETPEFKNCPKILTKSQSLEKDDRVLKTSTFTRQISFPNPGESCGEMCLSDELNQAERHRLRSHTSNDMISPDCLRFQRPVSSLSGNISLKTRPVDSKKAILRSFIQRNMVVRSANRDSLAKLALAIEEDNEEVDDDCAYVASTRLIENKVSCMVEEIKELKENLIEVQDELQVSVNSLI